MTTNINKVGYWQVRDQAKCVSSPLDRYKSFEPEKEPVLHNGFSCDTDPDMSHQFISMELSGSYLPQMVYGSTYESAGIFWTTFLTPLIFVLIQSIKFGERWNSKVVLEVQTIERYLLFEEPFKFPFTDVTVDKLHSLPVGRGSWRERKSKSIWKFLFLISFTC